MLFLAGCDEPPRADEIDLTEAFMTFADADNKMHLARFYDGYAHSMGSDPRKITCLAAMDRAADAANTVNAELAKLKIAARGGKLVKALLDYRKSLEKGRRELLDGTVLLFDPKLKTSNQPERDSTLRASRADALQAEIDRARLRVEDAREELSLLANQLSLLI